MIMGDHVSKLMGHCQKELREKFIFLTVYIRKERRPKISDKRLGEKSKANPK